MIPDDWRRYLAPAAFLLAATIAVVLIRSGVESGGAARGDHRGSPAPAEARRRRRTTTTAAIAREALLGRSGG